MVRAVRGTQRQGKNMGIPRHNDIVERLRHAADQQAKCEDAKQCDCFAVPTHWIFEAADELSARQAHLDELRSMLDDLHMHAVDGERGWVMIPLTEWEQVFERSGYALRAKSQHK